MVIKQWTKLLVCVLVLIASTILILFNKIDSAAGVGLIMGVMGYVFGNGHAIAETKKTQTLNSNVGG